MSYPVDLDEYTTKKLMEEIQERLKRHDAGTCSYCKRDHGKLPACKFTRRHSGAEV